MRINQILKKRKIHRDQYNHINCIRIHPTESYEHFSEKCELAWNLFKAKKPFLTEAWTSDRKRRFDVLDLIDDIPYEIETGKSYDKKDDSRRVDMREKLKIMNGDLVTINTNVPIEKQIIVFNERLEKLELRLKKLNKIADKVEKKLSEIQNVMQ